MRAGRGPGGVCVSKKKYTNFYAIVCAPTLAGSRPVAAARGGEGGSGGVGEGVSIKKRQSCEVM